MRTYLDHNAGSPLRDEVREAMVAFLGPAANPSSAHREGSRAREALEAARAEVAGLVGAAPREVVFTSGATEANNLALAALSAPGGRVVTVATEHASVLEPLRAREAGGLPVTVVGVDRDGQARVADIVGACSADTRGVSVALANGEVGTIGPVADVTAALRGADVLVHSDVAQAVGRMPVDMRRLGVGLLSFSSHKIGGPAGMGALVVRDGVAVGAMAHGGPQERGRRAGTENVAGAVGFGVAARLARAEVVGRIERLRELRDRAWRALQTAVPDLVRNGPPEMGLPNTLNITAPGCAGESLLVLLDLAGIAASLGSACAAGGAEPSHVLLAMGRDPDAARAGVRVSFGWSTTAADIDRLVAVLPDVVRQIRARRAA